METKIPIGKIIKQKLKSDNRSVAWLARQVNYGESNFSKKLNKNNIGIDLLFCISKILHEDFFAFYSKQLMVKINHKNTQK